VEGPTKVTGTVLELNVDKAIDKAGDALTGCNVVLVPAGLPRKPGQDRKDLMNVNAGIAKGTLEACAKYCPNAVVGIIVNPVNSIVPAMAELWEKAGLDPKNVIGITSLDCVRGNKFIEERMGKPSDLTVIGGHAGATILPLFSQDKTASKIPESEIPALDEKVQNAGTVVVKEKAGKGSATLSMAYAAARWAGAVLTGLSGKPTIECSYIKSDVVPELPYFASKVVYGKDGVKDILPIGKISAHEQARLDEMIPILKEEIDMGLDYAKENEFAK
jgi:malate dehydrogenase